MTTETRNNGVPKAERWTKGDRVTVFGSWDDEGTFWFTHATVYSCGAKQMVLTSASNLGPEKNVELGRHFDPRREPTKHYHRGLHIVPRQNDDTARETAMLLAATWLTEERNRLEQCMRRTPENFYYCRAIAKDIAKLHEPCAYYWER